MGREIMKSAEDVKTSKSTTLCGYDPGNLINLKINPQHGSNKSAVYRNTKRMKITFSLAESKCKKSNTNKDNKNNKSKDNKKIERSIYFLVHKDTPDNAEDYVETFRETIFKNRLKKDLFGIFLAEVKSDPLMKAFHEKRVLSSDEIYIVFKRYCKCKLIRRSISKDTWDDYIRDRYQVIYTKELSLEQFTDKWYVSYKNSRGDVASDFLFLFLLSGSRIDLLGEKQCKKLGNGVDFIKLQDMYGVKVCVGNVDLLPYLMYQWVLTIQYHNKSAIRTFNYKTCRMKSEEKKWQVR